MGTDTLWPLNKRGKLVTDLWISVPKAVTLKYYETTHLGRTKVRPTETTSPPHRVWTRLKAKFVCVRGKNAKKGQKCFIF